MMNSIFWGEFMGTLVLILLGNGVVANVLLAKTKGNGGGLIVITAGWAFAVTMGVFVATKFGSPGAHINPALTLSIAFHTGNFSHVLTMISAQMLGAILGATLVWLHYYPHWAETKDQSIIQACFCNSPAIKHTPSNFLGEFLGTFVLSLVIASFGASPNGLGPFAAGLLVWSIGVSLGGTTGYAINPARDLGPRIAHALLPIAGKGDSGWAYAWLPVVGPIAGAILGGIVAGWAKI
jgi:glycerol uptake facilitator protein